jgi:DNA replication initiation complex subunit (GINS family)
MNTQLVESLAQIISTLTQEEKVLLHELYSVGHSERTNFYKTATPEERANFFEEWAESHQQDTPLLSDEAISRESIYGGRG